MVGKGINFGRMHLAPMRGKEVIRLLAPSKRAGHSEGLPAEAAGKLCSPGGRWDRGDDHVRIVRLR